MSEQSALSSSNENLCRGVRHFIERHRISYRQLSNLCRGHRNAFSKSAAFRFVHGDLADDAVDRLRPVVSEALVGYLQDRGWSATEIEEELSSFINPEEYIKMIANRCLLLPEAVRHFRLSFDPFDVDKVPDRDQIFTNDALDAVVARLKDAVLYQRFVAVIGGVGSGKTLLKMRVATELIDADLQSSKIRLLYPEFFDFNELTVANIANAILAELGQVIPNDKARRVAKVKQVLTELQQDGIAVAIVIDEAHRLADKVISSFKNFWEMTNGRSARLLGVILYGQPSFVEARLRDTRFTEIRQRVQIIDMPKMNGSSRDYIAHRLRIAGGDIDQLFDPAAIDRLCLNAQTPLAIGNLVNGALMSAYHAEEARVTTDLPFFKTLSTGQQVLGIRRPAA